MSVKSFGSTHGGPYFRFKATEEQFSKFVFRTPILERLIDRTILPVGGSIHMPSGAVLYKRGEGIEVTHCNERCCEFNLYGHSPQLYSYPDETGKLNKLPEDLIEEIDFIIDNNLFTTWTFIYD
jgi:hypothetical protein